MTELQAQRLARLWGVSIPIARALAGLIYGDGGANG